ncbi:MAG: hypothetical protein ACM3IJ_03325 [Candidatus Levyibacteriota bacterium]
MADDDQRIDQEQEDQEGIKGGRASNDDQMMEDWGEDDTTDKNQE